MNSCRTRFAPTPSGYLHAGNALNFVLAWMLAKKEKGKILLRIDDLDAPRSRPEYVQDIFDTLHWLGLSWDEGPRDAAEHAARFSQSFRLKRYHELIRQLCEKAPVYACSCSRKELTSAEHECRCQEKKLALDSPDTALRLPVESGINPVIRRRDGIPASSIASLADDTDQNISLIVRGADLLPLTELQRYIARLLGLSAFLEARFIHHPLITDAAGNKLSKSAGSDSMKAWRENGKEPAEIIKKAEEIYQRSENWQTGK